MMEREVGEIFDYKGKRLQVKKLLELVVLAAFLTRYVQLIPLILVEYVTKMRVTMEMMSILKK